MQTNSTTLHDSLAKLEHRHAWISAECNDQVWHYLDTGGDGIPVLLLPGSVGDSAVFVQTLLSLGSQHRLIALTYPAVFDAHQLAHGLARLMDTLAIEQAIILGSSFAAYWIQFFALYYPERVHLLILGNGFSEANDLANNPLFQRNAIENTNANTIHAEWCERLKPFSHQPLQGYLLSLLQERQSPENLRSRLLGVVYAELCPPINLADTHIVILDCPDDPLIPAEAQQRLRLRYPKARHVSIEHGGHYPHLLNPTRYEQFLLSCYK